MTELLGLLMRTSRRGAVIFSVLAGLLAGASFTGLVSLINRALSEPAGASPSLAIQFAVVGAVALVTRIASQMAVNRMHYEIIFNLRLRLCRQLLATPLRHLEERGSPSLLAMLTEDVLAVSTGLLTLPSIIINLAIVTGCVLYLGWLSWPVMLWLAAFIIVGIATYRQPTFRAVEMMRVARQSQDVLFEHFRAITQGTKELKLHERRRNAFLEEELEQTSTRLRAMQVRAQDVFIVSATWGLFLFFIFIGILLFVMPRFLDLDRSVLVGYSLVVLYLQQPLQYVIDCTPFLGRGTISLRRIEELGTTLETEASSKQPGAPVSEPVSFSRVELVGVTHSYLREQENTRFTVGPLDLTLVPGEIVFLVGGNGSGKTTLAKVLTGLYPPESGTVVLNGEPVTPERLGHYRQHFSTVFSDFYLFERLLGLPDAQVSTRAQAYLDTLQLSHKVQLQGSTLSTTRLSQGQRKRLALLTAYLEDRPIYLFDEWAADQDPAFKDVFYRQLLPELRARGKTVIVISHDDAYFPVADRILRLESGQLVASREPAAPRELAS